MDDEAVSELEHENQCSIEFSRNAKGEFSWKIKRYHAEDLNSTSEAISRIQTVHISLTDWAMKLQK